MAIFAVFGRWNERGIGAGEISRTVGYVESSAAGGRRGGRIEERAEEAIPRRHCSAIWLRGDEGVEGGGYNETVSLYHDRRINQKLRCFLKTSVLKLPLALCDETLL